MRPVRFQAGLSLIELMIAMALSLLLMLGVLQIFLSSKQTYTANSALTHVQESGRFAMDFITYDLRNAGYKGECFSDVNPLIANATDDRFNLNIGMSGWDAENDLPTWPTGLSTVKTQHTDSIIIKHAATSAGTLNADVTPASSSITMTSPNSEALGTNVVISSALGCDIFKSNDPLPPSSPPSPNIAKAGSDSFSRSYTPEITKILLFQSNQYYIKNGTNGSPSLWRASWRNGSTTPLQNLELVEGIRDLQFEYGIGSGTGENRAVSDTAFIKANAVTNWNDVVAVKVRLLALGNEVNVASEDQIYDREKGLICKKGDSACDAVNIIEIPNRRLAQVFTSTVSVRNQLP
ncbi:type IV pilus assembly protein PilW [Pseudomonas seleniipraecipitans]|uniref:Type IV pilus assembly protein PilW n=2 Tax=Phytopseudomonas seleniipraecipitans TaxID=640205 RepID=A0A1G7S4M8_9GAMM|nr:type IV pilus assembly protein PilW [Pseudomonas seleniipraecipitans]